MCKYEQKTVMEWDETLKKLYYSSDKPSGYGGIDKLLRYAKKIHPQVGRKDVVEWLSGQDAYTLHKPTKKSFVRRPTVVAKAGDQLQADLLDVRSHSPENDGANFLLTAVDCFSRKGWAIPIRSKGGVQVVSALEKILDEERFFSLQTDKGKEFYNGNVRELLEKRGVKHFSSENETIKASLVERFNKTLRDKIHRYLTANSTNRFIGVLQDFVDAYNDTEHRSIGMAPNEVGDANQNEIFTRLYESGGEIEKKRSLSTPLDVGALVRITKARGAFERGYTPNWTRELFTVVRVNSAHVPVTYVLEDYGGEEIKGTFYRQELQRVKEPEAYKIEKVLSTRRRRGKKEFYVKWLGYPDSFNSWVEEKDMV